MEFNRLEIKFDSLEHRKNKASIEDIIIDPDNNSFGTDNPLIGEITKQIKKARDNSRPVILAFGAHLIKNGLGLVLKKMIEGDYITHLATNGAGSIHDWELAFQGKTGEDVKDYVSKGKFGIWEETGKNINLAIILGAMKEKGYGESVAEMINSNKLTVGKNIFKNKDLSQRLNQCKIVPGEIKIEHAFKEYSVQNSAFSKGIPFTVHPGFGYDIIYAHPLSHGASIGKTSETDFLKFVNSVYNLEGGGVYLSVGSSIMSPMIFEKSLSMSRNLANQKGKEIKDFLIVVNDIQEGNWDWNSGKEPEKNDPAYYLRFCKTFNRMGARELHYIQEDNRNFLVGLYKSLTSLK